MDTKWPLNTVESSTISKSQTIEANFFSLSIFLLSIILCSFSLSGVRANHRQAHALHPFSPSKDSPFFSASITNTASTHSLVFFTFFFSCNTFLSNLLQTLLVLGAKGPKRPWSLKPLLSLLGFSHPFSGMSRVFIWFTVFGVSNGKFWVFLMFFLLGLIELMD